MADEDGHPVVVLEAGHHVAEVSVGVPSRTGEPAEVRLFAHHGDPGGPGAEPVFGIDLVAVGSCISTLFALGGRPGTSKLSHPVGRATRPQALDPPAQPTRTGHVAAS